MVAKLQTEENGNNNQSSPGAGLGHHLNDRMDYCPSSDQEIKEIRKVQDNDSRMA